MMSATETCPMAFSSKTKTVYYLRFRYSFLQRRSSLYDQWTSSETEQSKITNSELSYHFLKPRTTVPKQNKWAQKISAVSKIPFFCAEISLTSNINASIGLTNRAPGTAIDIVIDYLNKLQLRRPAFVSLTVIFRNTSVLNFFEEQINRNKGKEFFNSKIS